MIQGADIVHMFFQYMVILAPLVIAYCFLSILFSWIKRLVDTMSGRDW